MADKMISARQAEKRGFYRENQDAFRAAKVAAEGGDRSQLHDLRQQQRQDLHANRPDGGYKTEADVSWSPGGSPWAGRGDWQQFRQDQHNPAPPLPPVVPPGPSPSSGPTVHGAFAQIDGGAGGIHLYGDGSQELSKQQFGLPRE